MKKKTIAIISSICVIAIAGGIFGGIYLKKQKEEAFVPTANLNLTELEIVENSAVVSQGSLSLPGNLSGVGIGLFDKDNKITNNLSHINGDNVKNGLVTRLYNATKEENTIRLLAFVGDKQMKFSVGGSEEVTNVTYTMPPMTYLDVPTAYNVDGLKLAKGVYDFWLMAEYRANETPTDDNRIVYFKTDGRYYMDIGDGSEDVYIGELLQNGEKASKDIVEKFTSYNRLNSENGMEKQYLLTLNKNAATKCTAQLYTKTENPYRSFVIVDGTAVPLTENSDSVNWQGGEKLYTLDFTMPETTAENSTAYVVTFPITNSKSGKSVYETAGFSASSEKYAVVFK